MNTAHTLTVTETKNKAGKYHYQVKDAQGNVISERKSNREYAASTIDGNNYFGRVDLAQAYNRQRVAKGYNPIEIAYLAK